MTKKKTNQKQQLKSNLSAHPLRSNQIPLTTFYR